MIKNAVFDDLGASENGAAICCSGKNLEFSCCQFISNRVTKNGGSIYFTNGNIKIYRSLFFKCYSESHVDGTCFGNSIYIDSNNAILNEISARLSIMSEDLCTDSCIAISNCITNLFEINATHNFGIGGASICRVFKGPVLSSF